MRMCVCLCVYSCVCMRAGRLMLAYCSNGFPFWFFELHSVKGLWFLRDPSNLFYIFLFSHWAAPLLPLMYFLLHISTRHKCLSTNSLALTCVPYVWGPAKVTLWKEYFCLGERFTLVSDSIRLCSALLMSTNKGLLSLVPEARHCASHNSLLYECYSPALSSPLAVPLSSPPPPPPPPPHPFVKAS